MVTGATGSRSRHILRRTRSALLIGKYRIASVWRILRIRVANDGVRIPWATQIGCGVLVRVTDGGSLDLGVGIEIGNHAVILVGRGRLKIGDRATISHGCTLVARDSIVIGCDALIAEYVTIRDQDHRIDGQDSIRNSGFVIAPIEIGDDVWIGAKASVFRGSRIGAHAVIGAHALVKGDIQDYGVAVGIPAKAIRFRRADDNR